MPRRSEAASSQRGSALLITLAFTGLVAAVALSFQHSMRSQIRHEGESADSLHAELAAQSGIEFARRQLYLDPLWGEDGETSVPLAGGSRFTAKREPGASSQLEPTEATVLVEGERGDGRVVLEARISVRPGDPVREKALVLGEDVLLENVVVSGDVLWTNAAACRWFFTRASLDDYPAGSIHEIPRPLALRELKRIGLRIEQSPDSGQYFVDYDPNAYIQKWGTSISPTPPPATQYTTSQAADLAADAWLAGLQFDPRTLGAWAPSPSVPNRTGVFERFDLRGKIYECALEGVLEGEEAVPGPVHLPGWSLDAYLRPAPCRSQLATTSLSGLSTDSTVVVELQPGEELVVEGCDLRGGLVVFADWGWNPLGAARNEVILLGDNRIGGVSGCSENVGLLAPASRVRAPAGGSQRITGLSFWHAAKSVRMMEHAGSLIVSRDFEDVSDSSFTYLPAVAERPPAGVLFYGGLPGVNVLQVEEAFPATAP